MRDFREYSPEDVIHGNLRENSKRMDCLREQELAHLRELAAEIVSVGELQEILSSLPDRRPTLPEVCEDTLEQTRETLKGLHKLLRVQRAMLLSSELCRMLTEQQNLTPESFFPDPEKSRTADQARIIYPRSGYADSAYLTFSEIFRETRAAYTHSFISACEEVYNGFCEYCILPLENSTEGVLAGFLRLIVRYDLRIAATCEIKNYGEGKRTRFALLQKEVFPLCPMSEAECFFSMMLPYSPSDEIAEVMAAASFFGLTLRTISFLPAEDPTEVGATYFAFSTPSSALKEFLLYLTMEMPHYSPVGLYPNIQKKGKKT